jgi:hypothetical protein
MEEREQVYIDHLRKRANCSLDFTEKSAKIFFSKE